MLKLKRKLSIGIAAVLTLSMLLVGCGSKTVSDSGTATTTQETESTVDSVKEELKPYDIIMVGPDANQADMTLVQDEMNKILKEKINATITLKTIEWGFWTDKVNLMFASNEKFDLKFTSDWMGPVFDTEVAKGVYIPLNDLLDKHGKDIQQILGPSRFKGATKDGNIYAVLVNKEFAATTGLLLRKDLIDKYKFDVSSIKTLEDLEPMLKTIKDNEPDTYPISASGTSTPIDQFIKYGLTESLGAGVGVLRRDGTDYKVENLYATDLFMKYTKLMHKWYTSGYINKDAGTSKDNPWDRLGAGKAFAFGLGLKPLQDVEMSRQIKKDLVAVNLTNPYTTTSNLTSAMWGISKTSQDPARAMMFLNLLYTDKNLVNLINFGIEGKHYIMNSNNQMELPAGVTTTGFSRNLSWMFGNEFLCNLWSNEDSKKWELYNKFNSEAEESRALGFTFKAESVKNEIAATDNVIKEFEAGLYSGVLDPEVNIPKLIEKLKAAGSETIIAEKQRQLDEWVKSKK